MRFPALREINSLPCRIDGHRFEKASALVVGKSWVAKQVRSPDDNTSLYGLARKHSQNELRLDMICRAAQLSSFYSTTGSDFVGVSVL